MGGHRDRRPSVTCPRDDLWALNANLQKDKFVRNQTLLLENTWCGSRAASREAAPMILCRNRSGDRVDVALADSRTAHQGESWRRLVVPRPRRA